MTTNAVASANISFWLSATLIYSDACTSVTTNPAEATAAAQTRTGETDW